MRARSILVLVWLVTGFTAVGGSIIGNAFGPIGLRVGAVAGGAIGVVVAVLVAARVGWLASAERRSAVVGGWAGFAVAAPIAALNLHTPITPAVSCALVSESPAAGSHSVRMSPNREFLQPRFGHSSMIALSAFPLQHQWVRSRWPRSRTRSRYTDHIGFTTRGE